MNAAKELGRRGGRATAARRSKQERSEAARAAVKARWAGMSKQERSAAMKRIRAGKKKR